MLPPLSLAQIEQAAQAVTVATNASQANPLWLAIAFVIVIGFAFWVLARWTAQRLAQGEQAAAAREASANARQEKIAGRLDEVQTEHATRLADLTAKMIEAVTGNTDATKQLLSVVATVKDLWKK